MYFVEVSDAFYLLQGLFVLKIWDFKQVLICHGSRSLDSAAGRSIYWLSCGIRFHEGVKKTMKKKSVVAMMLIAIMTASLAGCGSSKDGSGKSVKLDSDHPVSLTIWHYYNGAQQAMFDTLVKEFNVSVGKEEGIYVESYSQGSVSDLEEAVNSSLNGEVGAEELPDIFFFLF